MTSHCMGQTRETTAAIILLKILVTYFECDIPSSPLNCSLPQQTTTFSALLASVNPAMPDKIETLILWVDLECERCNRKIRRVISKLQDRANIQSVDYDEKGNKVILKGPFDPEWLAKKLCCKACKIIKQYEIVEPPPPPPPKPDPPPPPPEPKPDPPPEPKPEPKPDPPPEPKPDPPPEPKPDPPPEVKPVAPEPPPVPTVEEPPPPTVEIPPAPPKVDMFPYPYPYPFPFIPVCCHAPCPCYGGHGGCRCCSCGKSYEEPPPAPVVYPNPPPAQPCCDPCGYRIVIEEPSYAPCAIM
ncbi:Heavy metal transport/detoxification superfamily protein [Rhynchospora pubera]|uniref:Heavy metal transport/detoxification superfamily protein n=1 Tax=Rhynchospora pubera TaxID=906938 RepID=A0AAV8G5I9_9POAL|nr:Heavy metal transport/detoxification superfamily protein [Rhynchospora pubera]